MLRQIEEIKELWIFFHLFSTNESVLLLIGDAKCKLVLEDMWDLLDAKFQNVLHSEDFSLNSCVTLIIVEKCHTV